MSVITWCCLVVAWAVLYWGAFGLGLLLRRWRLSRRETVELLPPLIDVLPEVSPLERMRIARDVCAGALTYERH